MTARSRWTIISACLVAALAFGGWRLARGPRSVSLPPAPPTAGQPGSWGGTGPARPGEPDISGFDDILESQGAELTDTLSHLQETCDAASRPVAGRPAPSALAACVANAEQAVSLLSLIRESVESPAGADMPGDVRTRWERTLASDSAAVRLALAPVGQAIGRALASGHKPPDEFRALGHLRDRIDRLQGALGP